MKKQTIETATFGGRLCVRSGWFWIGATLADLEALWQEETRRKAEKRDLRIAFALAALAVAVTIVRKAVIG